MQNKPHSKEQEQYILRLFDDIVFMCFDLERGNFLGPKDAEEVSISEKFKLIYRRQMLQEYWSNEGLNVISLFKIIVKDITNSEVINFEVNGEHRKFTCIHLQSLNHLTDFANELQTYRHAVFTEKLDK